MQLPSQVEHVVRSRAARLTLAITLIALSIWVFAPYIGYRIASSAFVNAELVRINAPIAGRLTVSTPRKGEYFDTSRTLSFVESFSRDRRHLLDLERQHAVARDRSELARRQLTQLDAFDQELTGRIKAYREGVIQRLTHELAEADAERTGCLMEAQLRREVGTRMEELA
ncbi:MAG TPA: HlyD family secretion protein, partial [Pseudorhodoplanes sp.]|nr:HlyD family secretion protein [Pseudorhodoplanes sp.]